MVALCNTISTAVEQTETSSASGKLYQALWLELLLILQAKTAYNYQGEKKLSLSVARGLALSVALTIYCPESVYEKTIFLIITGKIDQQTA